MGLRDWLAGSSTQPDGFELSSSHPRRAEHEMLSAIMREAADPGARDWPDVETLPSFQPILIADSTACLRLVHAATERPGRMPWHLQAQWRWLYTRSGNWSVTESHMVQFRVNVVAPAVIRAITERALPWTPAERAALIEMLRVYGIDCKALKKVLPAPGDEIPNELRSVLERLKATRVTRSADKDMMRF